MENVTAKYKSNLENIRVVDAQRREDGAIDVIEFHVDGNGSFVTAEQLVTDALRALRLYAPDENSGSTYMSPVEDGSPIIRVRVHDLVQEQ